MKQHSSVTATMIVHGCFFRGGKFSKGFVALHAVIFSLLRTFYLAAARKGVTRSLVYFRTRYAYRATYA